MLSGTLPGLDTYLKFLLYAVKESVLILWQVVDDSGPVPVLLLVMALVFTSYLLFRFLKFLIKFSWIAFVLIGYEVVRYHLL